MDRVWVVTSEYGSYSQFSYTVIGVHRTRESALASARRSYEETILAEGERRKKYTKSDRGREEVDASVREALASVVEETAKDGEIRVFLSPKSGSSNLSYSLDDSELVITEVDFYEDRP
jgi:hypothetical protein